MTSKEARRRAAIEAEYSESPPPEPAHAPSDEERPLNAQRVIAALGDGWRIEEASATVWDLPKWKTVHPDDAWLSFVAQAITIYHLKALRTGAPVGTLSAVQVMYLDGKVARAWLGYGEPDGKGYWEKVPVASMARMVREALK